MAAHSMEHLKEYHLEEKKYRKKFWLKNYDEEYAEQKELNAIFGMPSYKYRLYSTNYLNTLNSKRPEAVFKIISGGIGKERVTSLINYITRNKAEFQEHERVKLYNEYGIPLTPEQTKEHIESWVQSNFADPNRYEKQSWKLERKNELEDEREFLQSKLEQDLLTTQELDRLENVEKILKENKLPVEPNKFYKGKPVSYKGEPYLFDEWCKDEVIIRPLDVENGASRLVYPKALDPEYIDLKVNAPDDFKHMLFSAGGNGHDPERLHRAFQQFAINTFQTKGFDYVYAFHNDTDNPHFHLVLNPRSRLYPKQTPLKDEERGLRYFNPNKEDLILIRQEFAHQLTMQGIERKATLKRDRVKDLSKVTHISELVSSKTNYYQEALDNNRPIDAFKTRTAILKLIDKALADDTILKAVSRKFFEPSEEKETPEEVKAKEQIQKIDTELTNEWLKPEKRRLLERRKKTIKDTQIKKRYKEQIEELKYIKKLLVKPYTEKELDLTLKAMEKSTSATQRRLIATKEKLKEMPSLFKSEQQKMTEREHAQLQKMVNRQKEEVQSAINYLKKNNPSEKHIEQLKDMLNYTERQKERDHLKKLERRDRSRSRGRSR